MTRIQDDLFATVNAEWLENAEIPADKPRISAFDELVLKMRKIWLKIWLIYHKTYLLIIQSCLKQSNFIIKQEIGKQEKSGFFCRKNELAKVETLNTFEDFKNNLTQLVFHSQAPLPFSFSVEPDMKDAIHYSLGFSGPGLILPDTTYYNDRHPRKNYLILG